MMANDMPGVLAFACLQRLQQGRALNTRSCRRFLFLRSPNTVLALVEPGIFVQDTSSNEAVATAPPVRSPMHMMRKAQPSLQGW